VLITPIKTRVFKADENLEEFIFEYIPKLKNGSILVITSKIAALSQGRVVRGDTSKVAKVKLMRQFCQLVLRTKFTWLTIYEGELMLSAGIDASNIKDGLVLLPTLPFQEAARLRSFIMRKYQVKKLGILITDNRTARMRKGSKGVSVGYAGFKGLRDYAGKKDLFGNKFKVSRVNVADSLAAGAVVCMGEGRERQPLAVIEDAPVEWTNNVDSKELWIAPEDDVYRPYFDWLLRRKR
jgi:F420-0:gamma-glutamyl ligase